MFLICGEALFDVFVDPIGADAKGDPVTALRAVPGGSPYNVAIGLARLERRAALCTEISGDRLGRRLEAALAAERVDLSFIRRSEGATPMALIDVDSRGMPHYGFHGVRQMCFHPLAQTFADRQAMITGIHVGSFPIVSERSSDELLALVASSSGRIVSLDPNIRLALEPDAALWRRQVERFRRHAHVVKTSLEDLEAIHGTGCDGEGLARSWVDGDTRMVVLTRGERGAILFAHDAIRIEIDAPAITVVDTVGAGDTYQAALLCWLDEAGLASPDALATMTRDQLTAMMRFAGGAAGLTCSRQGPQLPRRAELPGMDVVPVSVAG